MTWAHSMLQGWKVENAIQATWPEGLCPLFSHTGVIALRIFFPDYHKLVISVRHGNNSFSTSIWQVKSKYLYNGAGLPQGRLFLCKYYILMQICNCHRAVWLVLVAKERMKLSEYNLKRETGKHMFNSISLWEEI